MTTNNYLTMRDDLMSFSDIMESAKEIKKAIYFSWEVSLNSNSESQLTEEEIMAKDEILIFLIRLKRFVKQQYIFCNSDFMNMLLFPEILQQKPKIIPILTLQEIKQQGINFIQTLYFSWELSAFKMEPFNLNSENNKAKEELIQFLSKLDSFLSEEYQKAQTETLQSILAD